MKKYESHQDFEGGEMNNVYDSRKILANCHIENPDHYYTLYVCDDLLIDVRKMPNRFQRFMMKIFFGWEFKSK